MALSEVVKQFLASRRPLPSSLERDVEALPAAEVPERLGEGATTMPMQDLGTTPALSDNDPRRDRGYNTDRSSMTASQTPPEAPGATRQPSRVSAPQGPASTLPRAQEFVPEPVYPEAMSRTSFSSRPEAQAKGEGGPNADLRRAFVTEYPDDLGDAALREAQEKDRRAVAMADARDGFRHATSLITGGSQQAKVNPNAVAVEEFLKRRGVVKENGEGERAMYLWVLQQKALAAAEGRKFDAQAAIEAYKAAAAGGRLDQTLSAQAERDRLNREGAMDRTRVMAGAMSSRQQTSLDAKSREKKEGRDAALARHRDLRLGQLGKTMDWYATINHDVGTIDGMIKDNPEGSDLPGAGLYDSTFGRWGGNGGKNVEMRTAIDRIRKNINTKTGGKALTPHETKLVDAANALGSATTDAQFRTAWTQFKAALADESASSVSGFHPEVWSTYQRNQQGLGHNSLSNIPVKQGEYNPADEIAEWGKSNPNTPMPGDDRPAVRVRDTDGSLHDVFSEEDLQQALAEGAILLEDE